MDTIPFGVNTVRALGLAGLGANVMSAVPVINTPVSRKVVRVAGPPITVLILFVCVFVSMAVMACVVFVDTTSATTVDT